jgi:hypothetical protein
MKPLSIATTLSAFSLFTSTAHAVEMRTKFLEKCPLTTSVSADLAAPESGLASGLLEAIGGKLLNSAVDAVLNAIKPEDKSVSYQERNNGFFDGVMIRKEMSCMQVTVGTFLDQDPGATKNYFPWAKDAQNAISLSNSLKLASAPTFYMESQIVLSPDKTAIAWEPRYTQFGDFVGRNPFAGSTRKVVLTVGLEEPGGASALVSQNYTFSRAEPNSVIMGEDGSISTLWNKRPSAADSSVRSIDGKAVVNRPFSLKSVYIETPNLSRFATALFGSFADSKDAIKAAVADSVLPSKRDIAEKSKEDSAREAIEAYAAALSEWPKSCDASTIDSDGKLLGCQLKYLDLGAKRNAAITGANYLPAARTIRVPTLPTAPARKTAS